MCDEPWIDAHCPISCQWANCTTTTAPPTTAPPTPPTTAPPTPPTTAPPTTHVPNGRCDELCTDSMGQFMIPGEPTKWCHCSNWLGYVKDCAKCTKMEGHPLCEKYGQKLVFDDSSRRCDWPEIACKSRSDCPYTDFQQVAEKEGYADCELWAASGDCYDPAKHTEWACG